MLDLVGNPEDRFSQKEAHIKGDLRGAGTDTTMVTTIALCILCSQAKNQFDKNAQCNPSILGGQGLHRLQVHLYFLEA